MLRSPPENKSSSTSDLNNYALKETNPHTTVRDKRRRTSSGEYDGLSAFKNEIREMFRSFYESQNSRLDAIEKHIADLKSQVYSTNEGLEKSIHSLSEKIVNLEHKIQGFESQRNKIESQLMLVENKFENLEKNNRKTFLELRNVPKCEKETKEVLFSYIETLSNNINYPLTSTDIRDVYRLSSKPDKNYSTLVVELASTLVKTKILHTAHTYNKKNPEKQINSNHLGLSGDTSRIYLSESLTFKSRRIYFLARELAKSNGYKFCWTAHGNVLLRKEEGLPCIVVKSEEMINELKQRSA